ncbi:hypothetical protein FQN49_007983 [Arthroderma sp. PD_2]|nr:hypothetical protein FQN49_007983 [Arthroderma sp. PD_2]
MVSLFVFTLLVAYLASAVSGLSHVALGHKLGPILSKSASIDGNENGYMRWSEYNAPSPGAVVTPGTEEDVAVIVQFCIKFGIPFLAQAGGHGWSSTLDLHQDGIIINLRQLNTVTFNEDRTEATVGGGALISEVIEAASLKSTLVLTGNCNCVGALGANLGGGYGYLMGLYGFGVDNILSLNVVTGDGVLKTVTADNSPDLFWALRGAAPNFGVVTSVVMKAHPVQPSGQYAWLGALTYTGDKVEAIVEAASKLTLTPKMNMFFYFLTSGAPDYTPIVYITPWYYGTEAEGRAAFSSIIDIGPIADTTAETHYPRWNDGSAGFCINGGYKPSYGVGLTKLVPATWKKVWDEYVSWVSLNGTGNSTILMEAYSLDKARSFPDDSSSFPWRNGISFNAIAIPWYNDKSLEPKAESLGSRIRDLWRSTDGLNSPSTYINFAHGDEDPSVVYGPHLHRLQRIKAKEDPHNLFRHWYGIKPEH